MGAAAFRRRSAQPADVAECLKNRLPNTTVSSRRVALTGVPRPSRDDSSVSGMRHYRDDSNDLETISGRRVGQDWRRRPDLNRGWRFCRFRRVPYLVDSSCSLVSCTPRLSLVFGRSWTEVGLKFARSGALYEHPQTVEPTEQSPRIDRRQSARWLNPSALPGHCSEHSFQKSG